MRLDICDLVALRAKMKVKEGLRYTTASLRTLTSSGDALPHRVEIVYDPNPLSTHVLEKDHANMKKKARIRKPAIKNTNVLDEL